MGAQGSPFPGETVRKLASLLFQREPVKFRVQDVVFAHVVVLDEVLERAFPAQQGDDVSRRGLVGLCSRA